MSDMIIKSRDDACSTTAAGFVNRLIDRKRVTVLLMVLIPLIVIAIVITKERRQLAFFRSRNNLLLLAQSSTNYFFILNSWPFGVESLRNNSRELFFIPPKFDAVDEWRRPFVYKPFNSTDNYGAIYSYGADGVQGGIGVNADIEFRFGNGFIKEVNYSLKNH